ncbi:MAG: hypothetical protein HC871_07810, partial [Rhizobiales bacterium]|nr:hypothetical protein [Hyphomicrobiales bacterium]
MTDDPAQAEALTSVADNLREIEERIRNAALSAGRRADEVSLVAVSKA